MLTLDVWTMFGLAAFTWAVLMCELVFKWPRPWVWPALAVYMTIAAWYLIDFTYNGDKSFVPLFGNEVVSQSFLLVIWFFVALRVWIALLCANNMDSFSTLGQRAVRVDWEVYLLYGLGSALAFLLVLGAYNAGSVWAAVFPPFADEVVFLWGRGGVGSGTEFLVSAAGYAHQGVVGMLGVLAVVARRPGVRHVAMLLFIAALPPFMFQRARSLVLAAVMPGTMAFLIVGRTHWVIKLTFTVVVGAILNFWFLFMLSVRDRRDNTLWMQQAGGSEADLAGSHLGLDMLSELCHIIRLIDSGIYQPNIGERYLAEVAMVVPRPLWPGKPFIGIDYALARGFADSAAVHGVNTTVATGMIGQGVVNFGQLFGVVAAAFLAALWVRLLSGIWTKRYDPARLMLFMLGVGLTFNMGRDITLMVIFPFFAAWGAIRVFETVVNRPVPQ